ncbi:MAG: endonuclease/exonuclease/phosphatase family protein, partial [Pseudomonadota bacterium]
WPALQAWVSDLAPDVLCLQEVTRAPSPGPDWLVYRDSARRLDQRADLLADVSRCLPEHQVRFAAAARGHLQDEDGRLAMSEHGIACWIRRDLAIRDAWQGFVHGTYRHDGWGPEPVPRAMQLFRIVTADTGDELAFGHFHGLRDPFGKGDTKERLAQSRAVCDAVIAFTTPGEPFLLAGDFNLLPDSQTFTDLAAIGLHDQVTARGHTDTRTTLYPKAQRYANYCVTSRELTILRFDLPAEPEVSDHRPILVDIAMR